MKQIIRDLQKNATQRFSLLIHLGMTREDFLTMMQHAYRSKNLTTTSKILLVTMQNRAYIKPPTAD